MYNFNSPNAIIVYYPSFTGGKFISNCLSLSKHAIPQSAEAGRHLLDHPDDYEFRFNVVMSTLPEKSDMKKWVQQYELGDRNLFIQEDVETWYSGGINVVTDTRDIIHKIIDHKFDFFITAHGGSFSSETQNLLKVWPNAKVIVLINYEKFWAIASTLKTDRVFNSITDVAGDDCKERYNEIKGISWPSWEEFQTANYNIDLIDVDLSVREEIKQYYKWHLLKNPYFQFDIDNNIFDQDKFLNAMKKLYDQLGYDDFNHDLVGKFWQAYIRLHIDNV